MGKMIKSYRAFTTAGYRILALYLIPLGFLAVSLYAVTAGRGNEDERNLFAAMTILLPSWLVFLEVIVDYWAFGGILGREGASLELFQTSAAETAFLRRAVTCDCLRRLCWLMVYACAVTAATGDAFGFVAILIVYFVVTAALNLTRHLQIPWMCMMCAGVAIIVYLPLTFSARVIADAVGAWGIAAALALFSLLALAASWLSVWHILYCMRRKSYDE